MSGSGNVVLLTDISKIYKLYSSKKDRFKESLHPFRKKLHHEFFALKGVNLKIKESEILGVVGMNGSGKSTLLKIIAGIIQPSSGFVSTKGKIIPLLELGSGFNKDFTGLENVHFYCTMLGNTPKQIQALIPKILDFAELGEFIHQPLKSYSSGMRARLAFAVSINVDPDILILDEVLAVGDVLFRRKSFSKMEELFDSGKTVIYVSHSTNSINQLCTRAIFLDKGELLLEGPPKLVTMYYQKYIFSKPSEQPALKKLIMELNKDHEKKRLFKSDSEEQSITAKPYDTIIQDETIIQDDPISDDGFFIPNFEPKTSLKSQDHDVEIFDIMFSTIDGREVNVLRIGDKYLYSFKVKFNVSVRNVVVSVPFKTVKSIVVTGGINRNEMINEVRTGSIYKMDWHFECNFRQGAYFTNIGISGEIDGIRERLIRIIDASVFKVQTDKETDFLGFINMNHSLIISKLE